MLVKHTIFLPELQLLQRVLSKPFGHGLGASSINGFVSGKPNLFLRDSFGDTYTFLAA